MEDQENSTGPLNPLNENNSSEKDQKDLLHAGATATGDNN